MNTQPTIKFGYIGLKPDGFQVSGIVESTSEEAAIKNLRERTPRIYPMSLKEAPDGQAPQIPDPENRMYPKTSKGILAAIRDWVLGK